MIRFVIRRLIQSVAVLFIVISATFLFMRLAPGSPFSSERKLDSAVEARLLERYGLNGSISEQFVRYWVNLFHGDLGDSLKNLNWSVGEIVLQTLPHSLLLGGCSLLVALTLGILLGSYCALHHNRAQDRLGMLVALIGICLPPFLIAPLLILVFSLWIPIFPVAGWGSAKHLILPIICLSAPYTAYCARLMRSSMLDVLEQDFIRTARAKGLREKTVILLHALKVAILPLISYLGPLAANVLTGSLVVEEIFKIPGIGPFFIQSVLSRDVFMVSATVIIYSSLLIGMNLLVDILYQTLDPRVKLA